MFPNICVRISVRERFEYRFYGKKYHILWFSRNHCRSAAGIVVYCYQTISDRQTTDASWKLNVKSSPRASNNP